MPKKKSPDKSIEMDFHSFPLDLLYLANKKGKKYILRNSLRSHSATVLREEANIEMPQDLLADLLHAHQEVHFRMAKATRLGRQDRISGMRRTLQVDLEYEHSGAIGASLADWKKAKYPLPATVSALVLVTQANHRLCIDLDKHPVDMGWRRYDLQISLSSFLYSFSPPKWIPLTILPDARAAVRAVVNFNEIIEACFEQGFFITAIDSSQVMTDAYLNETPFITL